MKKIIDITTTSVIRPEIINATFQSFWDNMFSKYDYDYRLIINIDPIGDSKYTQKDISNIAHNYFSEVVENCPKTNNFATAVKWIWSNTTSKYVFNLEDMWLMLTPVNLDHLVYIIDDYPKIGTVNLYKYVISDGAPEPNFYQYNQKKDNRLFLQIRDPLLSPALHNGDFVREISSKMNDTDCPELQIWGDREKPNDDEASDDVKKCLSCWDYSLYTGNWKLPFWGCAIPTVDMYSGRKWKQSNGFCKKNPFSFWEKA